MWSQPLLYERLTWPEVRRAAAEDRVCVIPVGTLEDHGPHLPVDTDVRIITEICRRAAEEAPEEIVLLPTIPHGYDPHHMDFPGPISRRSIATTSPAPSSASTSRAVRTT